MSKTKEEVVEIALKYQLEIVEDTLIFNDSGLDFYVVYAKDVQEKEWVLRFPRRNDVMKETGHEKKILDLIHTHVSFKVPKWEIYEPDLIAYEKLSGVPMGIVNHEIQNYDYAVDINHLPDVFYESISKVLVELHNIPQEKMIQEGFSNLAASALKSNMKQRMENVKMAFGVGDELWERWNKWLSQEEMWPKRIGFIHGDVHPGHLLINNKIEVVGLIDWTECRIDDISHDFSIFYVLHGEAGLEKMLTFYEKAGGYVWSKMKEHIIELSGASALAVAEFALKSKLDEYVEMAKTMLEVET